MGSIVPFLRESSFDPELITVMSLAYEKAAAALHDTGQPYVVQEVIARQIIQLATQGFRDPEAMCERALEALGLNRSDPV